MIQPRLIFSLRSTNEYVDGRGYGIDGIRAVPVDTVALSFEGSGVGDVELLQLPPLPALRCLDLDSTKVTDKSLATLSQFAALEELWLECTSISNAGLKALHSCKSLRFVSLAYTEVTAASIASLKAAIPGIEVSA